MDCAIAYLYQLISCRFDYISLFRRSVTTANLRFPARAGIANSIARGCPLEGQLAAYDRRGKIPVLYSAYIANYVY